MLQIISGRKGLVNFMDANKNSIDQTEVINLKNKLNTLRNKKKSMQDSIKLIESQIKKTETKLKNSSASFETCMHSCVNCNGASEFKTYCMRLFTADSCPCQYFTSENKYSKLIRAINPDPDLVFDIMTIWNNNKYKDVTFDSLSEEGQKKLTEILNMIYIDKERYCKYNEVH